MIGPSWGFELWDGYDAVLGHLNCRTNMMVEWYAKYLKEKADVEKEYAKNLRKLVSKYEPVKMRKNKDTKEATEISSFR